MVHCQEGIVNINSDKYVVLHTDFNGCVTRFTKTRHNDAYLNLQLMLDAHHTHRVSNHRLLMVIGLVDA